LINYATRADFQGVVDRIQFSERAAMRARAEGRHPEGSTFLSHSSQDGDLLLGAIALLEGHGATVYVDKKDPTLPPYTSKETAAGLKSRISQSRKFVLLASKNSKESRWVPWELGIADISKGFGRVAVLPTLDERWETAWTNWEYLGLYDRIVWGDLENEPSPVWMVLDERKNTATRLDIWLKQP
jgi:hypothetical protein